MQERGMRGGGRERFEGGRERKERREVGGKESEKIAKRERERERKGEGNVFWEIANE